MYITIVYYLGLLYVRLSDASKGCLLAYLRSLLRRVDML